MSTSRKAKKCRDNRQIAQKEKIKEECGPAVWKNPDKCAMLINNICNKKVLFPL